MKIEIKELETLERIYIVFGKEGIPTNIRSDVRVPKSGIYFLYDFNDELVYIGQSKHLASRITQHVKKKNLRAFDPTQNDDDFYNIHNTSKIPRGIIKSFSAIGVDEPLELNMYESIYINLYKPMINLMTAREAHNHYLYLKINTATKPQTRRNR